MSQTVLDDEVAEGHFHTVSLALSNSGLGYKPKRNLLFRSESLPVDNSFSSPSFSLSLSQTHTFSFLHYHHITSLLFMMCVFCH